MKKILFTLLQITLSICAFSQTTIVSESFDNLTTPTLPSNWSSSSTNILTWRTDSSNFSSGYTNASGAKNMMLRNSDSTGTHALISAPFSTTSFSSYNIIWASRVSTNFLSSGSTLPTLSYSIDNGQSWNTISYIDNPANATWAQVNNGTPIDLPTAALNQASVMLKWEITIVYNTNGTYRIDDLLIQGTGSTVGFSNSSLENKSFNITNGIVDNGIIKINSTMTGNGGSIKIFNQSGSIVKQLYFYNQSISDINLADLSKGLYILEFDNSNKKYFQKIIIQ